MSEAQLADRVDSLEYYMKELSYQTLKTEMELAQLSTEMREFKNEMRVFKKEMLGFKNEMLELKEEARLDRIAMNRKWGELANKMGTLAEDIVAPNLPRVARDLFGCEKPELYAVRMRKTKGPETREYDVILACAGHVLVNETRSSLQSRDVDGMIADLKDFRDFFPEYTDRKLVGILASLYVDESIIRFAASKGILVMAMGEETMQLFNADALKTY